MVNLLDKIINDHIDVYIAKVSKTFGIPETRLKNIWKNDNPKIIIYKLKKYNLYVHKETRMVFKSPVEQKVIGKLKNNNILSLEKRDIEICKNWKFQIGI